MQLGKRYTFAGLNVLLYTFSSEYSEKTSKTEIGHQNYRFRNWITDTWTCVRLPVYVIGFRYSQRLFNIANQNKLDL